MRVDFYQLSRDPAEMVVPLLAAASKKAGQRLLVVSDDAQQLGRIDKALWEMAPDAFLAHGIAGAGHDEDQPALLAHDITFTNAAKFIILADGKWREAASKFERAFLLFGDDRLQEARTCWTALGKQEGDGEAIERHFWKQDGGKWREMG